MHEFEARYKAFTAGLDIKHVEAAELLVEKAMDMSATTLHPLPDVLRAMLTAATACADADALTATAAAEINQLQSDIDDLNALLRGVGWGQGEIDSSASFAEEYERLQALVGKLPKCWRLDEHGKLVRDVPMVPGTEVFLWCSKGFDGPHRITEPWIVTVVSRGMVWVKKNHTDKRVVQEVCYSTREAAEKASEKPSSPEDSGV